MIFLGEICLKCLPLWNTPQLCVGYTLLLRRALYHTQTVHWHEDPTAERGPCANQLASPKEFSSGNQSQRSIPHVGCSPHPRSDWPAECDLTRSPFWIWSDIRCVQQLVQNKGNNLYVRASKPALQRLTWRVWTCEDNLWKLRRFKLTLLV